MAFMVMKLKSALKTYALKIKKDDFIAIQKDPSLLAEYWDRVLEDEKAEQKEKPRASRPAKRRSKSVGAEARKREKSPPHDETVTNGSVHCGRKKSKQKEHGGRKYKKGVVSPKSTVGKQVDREPEKVPVCEHADSQGLKSPVKDKKRKSKQANKVETKGGRRPRKCLSSPKSVLNEEMHLEPKDASVDEGSVEDHFSGSGSTGSKLSMKERKTFKQPVKTYQKGLKKGVDFDSVDDQKVLKAPLASVDEENVQEDGIKETELVYTSEKTSSVKDEKVMTEETDETDGISPRPSAAQLDTVLKKKGRKRKLEVTSEEYQTTLKGVAAQDEGSTTVQKDISDTVASCLSPEKSNEKELHENLQENKLPPNVLLRRSARQQQRQQKQDETKCVAFSPEKGSVLPQVETNSSRSLEGLTESTLKMISGHSPQKISPVCSPKACVPENEGLAESTLKVISVHSPQKISPVCSPKAYVVENGKLVISPVKTISSTSDRVPVGSVGSQLKMASGHSPQKISSAGSPKSCAPENVKCVSSPAKTLSSTSEMVPVVCAFESTKLVLHTPLPEGTAITPVQIQNVTTVGASTHNVTIFPGLQSTPPKVTQPLTASSCITLSTVPQNTAKQTSQEHVTSSSVSSVPLASVVITPVRSSAARLVLPKVGSQNNSLLQAPQNITQALASPCVAVSNSCQLVQSLQTPCIAQDEVKLPFASPAIRVTPKNSLEQSATRSSRRGIPAQKVMQPTLKEISTEIKESSQQSVALFSKPKAEKLHDLEASTEKVSLVKSLASKADASQDVSTLREQDSGTAVTVIYPAKRGRPPLKRKSQVVSEEVDQSGVAKGSSEVESKFRRPEVKSSEGTQKTVASEVAMQKGKLPHNLSGVKMFEGKSKLLLNQNTSPEKLLDNLKTGIAKKMPLKFLTKPKSTEDKLKSGEKVVEKDLLKGAMLSDNVSVVLVPVTVPSTSNDYLGTASENIAQVNVTRAVTGTTQKLSSVYRGAIKRNLKDIEDCATGPTECRKFKKVSVVMGETDVPLEISQSADAVVHSPPKTVYTASSATVGPGFKIVHPLKPPIFHVSKKVSSEDDSRAACPSKVSKTPLRTKEIVPKIGQVPTVDAGTLLESLHNVSASGPAYNAVQTKSPSRRVLSKSPVISEILPGDKTSTETELQSLTVSPPGLNAFEALLNEGLDSITQLLAEKALACKKLLHFIREKKYKTCT